MTCASGYSPISTTDTTCVRDCAKGYYSDGDICWPICPSGSIDIGPSCTKNIVQRLPLTWTTANSTLYPADMQRRAYDLTSNGDQPVALNGSHSAGCPPFFANYISANSANEKYADGITNKTKCFIACPVIVQGSGLTLADQTVLDATGSCLSTVSGIDDYANLYNYQTPVGSSKTSPYNSFYEFDDLTSTEASALTRYPSGSTIGDAYQSVTNQTKSSLKIYADRGTNQSGSLQRTYSLPVCGSGQRAQFFATTSPTSIGQYIDSVGIATSGGYSSPSEDTTKYAANITPTLTPLTPTHYYASDGVTKIPLTTTLVGTTASSVTGTSLSPGIYQNFFLCKNVCPDGTKRYSDYCMPDCPTVDLASLAALNNLTQANYNSLIYPPNDAPQRKCLKNVESPSASTVTKNYTSSNTALPTGIENFNGTSCPINTRLTPRWKTHASYTNPQLYQVNTSIPSGSLITAASGACINETYNSGICPVKIQLNNSDTSQRTVKVGVAQTFNGSTQGTGSAGFPVGAIIFASFSTVQYFTATVTSCSSSAPYTIVLNPTEVTNPSPSTVSSSSNLTILTSSSQVLDFEILTSGLSGTFIVGTALNPVSIYSGVNSSGTLVATGVFTSIVPISGSSPAKQTLTITVTTPPASTTSGTSWFISQPSNLAGTWKIVQRLIPLGFIDNPSAFSVTVVCSTYANCADMGASSGTTFEDDTMFSNICNRPAVFTDPATSLPTQCPVPHSLMGEPATLQDTTFTLGGYKAELFPRVGRVISAGTNVYSPYSAYSFGDVVSMGQDAIEMFKGNVYSLSVPWQDGIDEENLKTFKNKTYGNLTGPFFKCTNAYTPALIDPSAMITNSYYVIAKINIVSAVFTPDFTSLGSLQNVVGTVFKYNGTSISTTNLDAAVMEVTDAMSLNSSSQGQLFSILDPGKGFNWTLLGCPPNPIVGRVFKLNYVAPYSFPNPLGNFRTGWVLPCLLPAVANASVNASHIIKGYTYTITTTGSTNFITLFGSSSNAVGTTFVANSDSNPSSGSGTVTFQNTARSKYLKTSQLINGDTYVIASVGTTNFMSFGSTNNLPGTVFIASGVSISDNSTGLVLPSADYDYSSFFVQDTNSDFPLMSNSYWSSINIPTRKLIEDNRLAGADDFQFQVCQQNTTGSGAGTSTTPKSYAFCPPLCTNSCATDVDTKTLTPGGSIFGDPLYIQGNVLQTLKNSDSRLAGGDALSSTNLGTVILGTPVVFSITMEGSITSFLSTTSINVFWVYLVNRIKQYIPVFSGSVQYGDSTTVRILPTSINNQTATLTPSTYTPIIISGSSSVAQPSALTGGQWYMFGQGNPIPSYVGYRVPTFNFGAQAANSSTPVLDSHCYFRCGSSGSWSAEGRFCVSQTVPQTLDPNIPSVIEGFSWCPAPNSQTSSQNPSLPAPLNYGAGQYEIGDAYADKNNVHSNEERAENPRPPFRICLTACPEGYYVTNTPPYDKCVTRCPLNSGFQNELTKCTKIPYSRQIYGGPAIQTQTPSDVLDDTASSFAPIASKGSKIALSNGPSTIFKWILYLSLFCGIIILIMTFAKYNIAKQ